MGSKYVDLIIAIFMGIFAVTRFNAGQTGFAILFIVLCIANLIVFYIKHTKWDKDDIKKE
ncbi:MAG TPA: hypothetical protein VK120_00405 [Sporosarcina sp.]|nr:hypothetical protein [Sporosarcina sp.]